MYATLFVLLSIAAGSASSGDVAAPTAMFSPGAASHTVIAADTVPGLYRDARRALNAGDLFRAAELFHRIHAEHPRWEQAGDALFWEAFARHRIGGEIQLRRALALLETQAARHADTRTRANARALEARIRGALAEAGDATERERLSRDARQDTPGCEDSELRAAALMALARSDPAEATNLAVEALQRRDSCATPLRELAVHLLARHGGPASTTALLEAVRADPEPRVQLAALWTLARTAGSANALTELYRTLESDRLRQAVLFSVPRMAEPEVARAFLRALALDPAESIEIREMALHALARDAAQTELADLYHRFDEPRLRHAAVFALLRRPEGDAVELLIEIARTEIDPRVREAVVHTLARSDDPRARRFLRDLITRP
jgi:hypothetical protein